MYNWTEHVCKLIFCSCPCWISCIILLLLQQHNSTVTCLIYHFVVFATTQLHNNNNNSNNNNLHVHKLLNFQYLICGLMFLFWLLFLLLCNFVFFCCSSCVMTDDKHVIKLCLHVLCLLKWTVENWTWNVSRFMFLFFCVIVVTV